MVLAHEVVMNAIARIGLGATLGLLALGCSGGSLGSAGTGGTGGVLTGEGPGNGGQGGGTGGAGVGATLQLPGCLRDLLGPCAPQGSCVIESVSSDATNACFETGVRASERSGVTPGLCSNGGVASHVIGVSKADGTPCYTFESAFDAGCQMTQYNWKDTAGNIVATGRSHSAPDWYIEITCAATGEAAICGEPRPLPLPSGCCGVSDFGAAACTAGVQTSYCTAGSCPGVGGTSGRGGMGGGTGGTAAGGTGGGRGGTGGYSTADLELPACVKNLVAACATGGTCTSAETDGGTVSDLCFASGVRATFSGQIGGTSSSPRTVRVTKADGSPCYSLETALIGGELYRYTWKDAAGEVVATGTNTPFETPSFKIMCADGSETKTCHSPVTSPTGACCTLSDLGNATCVSPVSCTAGSCP